MADVARASRVSIKTVSRVVNDEPGVRSDTARRVRAVILDLGFHRHDGASMLRKGRSTSIGLIVEDLGNPFYSQLASAIEREAGLRQHLLISTSAEGSAERETELVDALVSQRVCGLILLPASSGPSEAVRRAAVNLPVVCVDSPMQGLDADTVLSDNDGGIRSAVEHLAAHRHERIAFVGDAASVWTARRRKAAFIRTYESLGLPGTPRTCLGRYPPGAVVDLLRRWTAAPAPVTAVVTGNNRITLEVLRAERELGLELALVGYDDFELADFLQPGVTVVHQDPTSLGERAVQQIFARLDGDSSPPRTLVVPTRLVVRGSSVRRSELRARAGHPASVTGPRPARGEGDSTASSAALV